MKVPTLYLDTSVIGGDFDDEWKDATLELFQQASDGLYRLVTSVVAARSAERAAEGAAAICDALSGFIESPCAHG